MTRRPMMFMPEYGSAMAMPASDGLDTGSVTRRRPLPDFDGEDQEPDADEDDAEALMRAMMARMMGRSE